MISQGQAFRLHLEHVDDRTVAVDLQIGNDDRIVGHLHGQPLVTDIVSASRALTSRIGGAASALRHPTGSIAAKKCIEKLREKHPNAYTPRTAEDDRKLLQLYGANIGIVELAHGFGRQPSAVRSSA